MSLVLIPVGEQSPGGFDNGRITERRPVMFVHRGAHTDRLGPLFYWAWAVAEKGGFIAEHAHQGFEIISYVLEGTIEHRDSLGTWKALGAGALQVMQTNAGVSHSERFVDGMRSAMFQIWFEPDLRETVTLPPSYIDFPADAFPWIHAGGNRIKHLVGEGSPAVLRTDAHMHDIVVRPRGSLTLTKSNVYAVLVAISGTGTVSVGDQSVALTTGDAAIARPGAQQSVVVNASDEEFRYVQVMVPVHTPYPLYPNQ